MKGLQGGAGGAAFGDLVDIVSKPRPQGKLTSRLRTTKKLRRSW